MLFPLIASAILVTAASSELYQLDQYYNSDGTQCDAIHMRMVRAQANPACAEASCNGNTMTQCSSELRSAVTTVFGDAPYLRFAAYHDTECKELKHYSYYPADGRKTDAPDSELLKVYKDGEDYMAYVLFANTSSFQLIPVTPGIYSGCMFSLPGSVMVTVEEPSSQTPTPTPTATFSAENSNESSGSTDLSTSTPAPTDTLTPSAASGEEENTEKRTEQPVTETKEENNVTDKPGSGSTSTGTLHHGMMAMGCVLVALLAM